MPAYDITEEQHVINRESALKTRLFEQHTRMRDIDAWRHLDSVALEAIIYQNAQANNKAPRKVVVAPNAYAVTNTCVALAATGQPKIDAVPVDQTAAMMLRQANVSERLAYAVYHTLNKDRDLPLLDEAPEFAFSRGVHIYKYCWLSPEDRGEVRAPQPIQYVETPFGEAPDTVEEVIVPGTFPALVQVLDPLDCFWAIGKDGRATEFIHEYRMAWDELVDLYPDAADMEQFQEYKAAGTSENTINVIDYWNDEINAILFDQKFYKKPTKHNYRHTPVIVEMANVTHLRNKGVRTSTRVANPVCWPMIPALTWSSWMASLMATYLQFSVIQSYKLRGVNSTANPHVKTDPETGQQTVDLTIDFTPGGQIVMLYDNEDLEPIQGADISPLFQRMQGLVDSHMAMTGMSEPILTGVYPVEPNSGYATVQQRFTTEARIQDTLLSISRGISRLMTAIICELIPDEWDYGTDAEMVLTDLMATNKGMTESPLRVTREMFEAVREIVVKINPEMPMNDESQKQAIFQAIGSGVLSRYRAIEQLKYAPDPEEELLRINAENAALTNPQMQMALTREWAKMQGYGEVEQMAGQMAQPQPPQPQQPMNAPPPLPSPSPAGGAVPQAAPAPAGGGPEQVMAMLQSGQITPDQLPPELLQELMGLMQGQMGGQMPMQGPPMMQGQPPF